MKKTNDCDIEKLFTAVGETLRKQEFVLEESIFSKILPKIEREFQYNNQKLKEAIFVWDIIRNVFAPVVVGGLLLILTFRIFGEKNFFYLPIELELKNVSAQQVEVIGDFTNWQRVKLKNQNGSWYKKFYLKPGRYKYIYVIDNDTFFLEPEKEVLEDDFGNKNSVLVI